MLKPSHVVVDKDFIGIESVPCDCGVYAHQGSFITRSERATTKWRNLLDNSGPESILE